MADLMVVGWNVHHGTSRKHMAVDVSRIKNRWGRPQGFCFNEFKPAKEHDEPFKRSNYLVRYVPPEYGVAIDHEEFWRGKPRFKILSTRRIRVGDLTYWAVPYLFVVRVRDRKHKKTIKYIVCHPPAHLQRSNANEKWPTIRRVARNIWGLINRISVVPSRRKNTVVLAWGDLNIDINKGIVRPFSYWLRGVPRWLWSNKVDDLGNREISVFGVEGLVPVGDPQEISVAGDHDAIMRKFNYAA